MASAALKAEVARIAREGVRPAELQRVKTQWRASEVYKLDSVVNQARELGSQWVQGLPLDAGDRLIERLRGVSALGAHGGLGQPLLHPRGKRRTAIRCTEGVEVTGGLHQLRQDRRRNRQALGLTDQQAGATGQSGGSRRIGRFTGHCLKTHDRGLVQMNGHPSRWTTTPFLFTKGNI